MISIYVPSSGSNAFPTTYSADTAPSIDGFDLRGGDQQGFPGNINEIGGGPTGLPAGLVTQGGAIFANAYARNLQITNNVVQNNGGALRHDPHRDAGPAGPRHQQPQRGRPHRQQPDHRQRRHQPGRRHRPLRRRDGYEVAGNDICGNFSAEYGGGLSVYGYSPNGNDPPQPRSTSTSRTTRAAAIMIAGELPADPNASLSPGLAARSTSTTT